MRRQDSMSPVSPGSLAFGSVGPRTVRCVVVAKGYPRPTTKFNEAMCVGGVTDQGEWIPLWPIPFRDLPPEQQFETWEWIEAQVVRDPRDARPESWSVIDGTIRRLGAAVSIRDGWAMRRGVL